MAKTYSYKELIKKLLEYDKAFEINTRRGKGSERMIYHPDINGRPESYPIKHHGDKTEIKKGHISALRRRFNLPKDFFD